MSFYSAIEETLLRMSYWEILKGQCRNFSNKIRMGHTQGVYRFEVVLELSTICGVSCRLATKIIYDLKATAELFEDVIFHKIKFWDLMEEDISRDQVYAVLRVQGQNLNLSLLKGKGLTASQNNRLVFFEGLVDSVYKPTTYLQSTCYKCEGELCKHSLFDRKRVHFSISESEDINQLHHRCAYCKRQMIEDKTGRTFGEKLLFTTKCLKPLHADEPAINMSSVLCCRDELIPMVKLSRRYTFAGICTFHRIQSKYVAIFEVQSMVMIVDFPSQSMLPGNWDLLKDVYVAFMKQSDDENNNVCKIIPLEKQPSENTSPLLINFLHPDLNISSWQYVFNLAKIFASMLAPADSYFGVKLITLLTMALETSKEESSMLVSFCISAADTRLINDIFKYSASFCPYCIHYSNTMQLFPHVALTDRNKISMNVGSFLWTNCIYIFNDLELCNFSKKDFTLLMNVLETGKVTLDFGQEYANFKGSVNSLTTKVWASRQHNDQRVLSRSSRNCSSSVKDQKMDQLVNSFHLLFRLDAWEMDSAAILLAEHTLFHAVSEETLAENFSSDQWLTYFDSVRKWNAPLSNDAKELVHKYYIRRRSFSQDNGNLVHFPSSLTQTLIALSSSFAKLAFAAAIDVSHVIVAIILVEENLLVRTGSTPFHSLIKRHLPVKVTSLFYEPQSDEKMKVYENEILNFVFHD